MTGVWLKANESCSATGRTNYDFQKHSSDYRSKPSPNGKTTLYFIPFSEMTDKAQKNLAARAVDEPDDDVADIVEGILGDVSHGSLEGAMGIPLDLDSQLQAAQLDNIKARTKMLGEKLERRKTELFNEWSEAFFTAFSEAFSKFKNDLISLQLTEEQLTTLQDKLDFALKSLSDKLAFLEADYADDSKEDDDLLNNGNN